VTKAIATLGLGEERIEDTCSREVFNQLDEAVCEGGVPKLTPVDCAQFTNSEGNGGYCEEGRCIIPPEPIPCTDNDADQGDIQAQAMVRSTTEIGVGESYEDQCAGVEGKENYVQERTCFQGMVGFEEFNCEESGMVCRDGACVEAPPEEPAPVEAVEDPAAEAAPAPAAAQTGGVCDEKGKRQKIGASFHECYDVSGALQWRILLKQACVSSNQCIPNAECQNSMCLGSAGTLCGNDASLCVKGLECSSEQKCVAPAAPSPAPAAGGAGGGVAPPAPGKCEIPGDKDPCDGKIDDLELSMYIGWWLKADQDPMNDLKLSQAIGAWLKG
jgi:hypothetical protein